MNYVGLTWFSLKKMQPRTDYGKKDEFWTDFSMIAQTYQNYPYGPQKLLLGVFTGKKRFKTVSRPFRALFEKIDFLGSGDHPWPLNTGFRKFSVMLSI